MSNATFAPNEVVSIDAHEFFSLSHTIIPPHLYKLNSRTLDYSLWELQVSKWIEYYSDYKNPRWIDVEMEDGELIRGLIAEHNGVDLYFLDN